MLYIEVLVWTKLEILFLQVQGRHRLNWRVEVKFCTKPSKQYKAESESAKRESIIRHFGQEFSKSMITTHDKTEIRASVLIDDSPIIVWTEDPERTHILVDQPHNQGMDKPRLYLDRLDERKWVIQQYL